jgi:hypothetical protein
MALSISDSVLLVACDELGRATAFVPILKTFKFSEVSSDVVRSGQSPPTEISDRPSSNEMKGNQILMEWID